MMPTDLRAPRDDGRDAMRHGKGGKHAAPGWLGPLMTRGADAMVRHSMALGASADSAQHIARDVWRQAMRRFEDPPPLGWLLHEVARRTRRVVGPAAGVPPWMRRLSPSDQAVVWVAAYTTEAPDVAAAAERVSPVEWAAALARAWSRAHPHESAPGDGAPPGLIGSPEAAAARFDWARWDPEQPEAPLGAGSRRRRAGLVGAGVVVVAGVGALWWQQQQATRPPASARLPRQATALTVTLVGGGPLYQRPWGQPRGRAMRGTALGTETVRYRVQGLSQAAPGQAYQVGPIHFALSEQGGVTSLVMEGATHPGVRLLSSRGQRLTPATTRASWTVYRVAGRAGTIRVAEGPHAVVLAWAAPTSPRREVSLSGAVWNSGVRWVAGFSGSWRFDAPNLPAELTPVATLRSGVLAWSAPHHYWLLPPSGPAVSLFTDMPSFQYEGPLVVAGPYPGAVNAILVSGALGSGADRWWNVASDQFGVTPMGSGPVWPTAYGWVDASPGTDAILSYATPPQSYYMRGNQVGGVAWAHRVLVERMQGADVVSTGVYNWRTRRYRPVPVPPAAGVAAVVALPVWGPTYVQTPPEPGGAQGFATATWFGGPTTVSLVRADGGPGLTIPVVVGATLTPGPEWLVLQSSGGPTNAVQVGWPDAAGVFRWHTIVGPLNASVTVTNTAIYWSTVHHVYVWMPPFARP